MNIEIWWIWMGLAAIFVIAEIFTAGFFILWFGIGAALAGIIALLGGGTIWQWLIFIVVSTVLVLISRRFADRFSHKQPPGIGADRLIGQHGLVIEHIDEVTGTGKVRIGSEEWRATSADSGIFVAGERVEINKVEGTHVVVSKIKKGK